MKRNIEFRTYAMRVTMGAEKHGALSGVASQMGVLDAYRSVILPGAFDDAIAGFLKSGHVCFNHNQDQWIGIPTEARVEGRNLVVAGEFYEDEFSQSIRSKLMARQDQNKETDFSVGFWPDWDTVSYFNSGAELWKFSETYGVNMSLMDSSIRDHQGYCWTIGKVRELSEWGPVTAGATPGAGATGARSLNDLRDPSLADMSLENHLDCALAAVAGVESRFKDYSEMRTDDGRAVSRDRLAQVEALAQSLANLAKHCRADDPKWRKLQMSADAFLAGL